PAGLVAISLASEGSTVVQPWLAPVASGAVKFTTIGPLTFRAPRWMWAASAGRSRFVVLMSQQTSLLTRSMVTAPRPVPSGSPGHVAPWTVVWERTGRSGQPLASSSGPRVPGTVGGSPSGPWVRSPDGGPRVAARPGRQHPARAARPHRPGPAVPAARQAGAA